MSSFPTNVNFSDSSPPAKPDAINVEWQADVPVQDPNSPGNWVRNESACYRVPQVGGVYVVTANYQLSDVDSGFTFVANSSTPIVFTLPLTVPILSPGQGVWNVKVINLGTGAVTIAPNGRLLNFGSTSLTLPQGAAVEITTDGTDDYTSLSSIGGLGGAPTVSVAIIELSLAPSSPGAFQVAHGQAATPLLVTIEMTSGGSIWFQTTRYDATYIYLVASDSGITGKARIWSVGATQEVALAPSSPGNFSVAHSLGITPALVLVQMTSAGGIWLRSPAADASNVYLAADDSGETGFALLFSAVPKLVVVSFAEVALTPSSAGNFSVAHGLSGTPKLVIVRMTSAGAIWQQVPGADSTNLLLVASDAGVTGYAEVWT